MYNYIQESKSANRLLGDENFQEKLRNHHKFWIGWARSKKGVKWRVQIIVAQTSINKSHLSYPELSGVEASITNFAHFQTANPFKIISHWKDWQKCWENG